MKKSLITSAIISGILLLPHFSFAAIYFDTRNSFSSTSSPIVAGSIGGGYTVMDIGSTTQNLSTTTLYVKTYLYNTSLAPTCEDGEPTQVVISNDNSYGVSTMGFNESTSSLLSDGSCFYTIPNVSWSSGKRIGFDYYSDANSGFSYKVLSTGSYSTGMFYGIISPTNYICISDGGDCVPTLSSLALYKSDATSTLSEGSSTTETTVAFKAQLFSSTTSTIHLEIEVTTSTIFSNIANVTSSATSSGNTVTATKVFFPETSSNGNYHWQARAVDSAGNASAWQTPTSTDFIISTIPLYTQIASIYPSTTTTATWANAPYDDALPGTGCNQSTSTIGVCGCFITSAVEVLRSYGITTNVSGTDVNPLTLNNWLASTTGGYDSGGHLNFSDIQNYAKTASGTFRVVYTESPKDHIISPSSTWVNKWLNHTVYATGTVPVILTVVASSSNGATTTHFIPATGFVVDPLNQSTSTYTVRDPYFYNTQYLHQATSSHAYNYSNSYQGAHVLEPTSTTVLPLYLEYAIDSTHTLLITDPSGNRLGTDPATGAFYNEIPNSGEDDDQPGSRFLNIYTPVAGRYTITVGKPGSYKLYSYVFNGKDTPTPQIISAAVPTSTNTMYHQNYNPTDLPGSTVVAQ